MTYRQIVYMILDEIKQVSDDSFITEDHVIFLVNYYRQFLLQQKKEKSIAWTASLENYQELCIDLNAVDAIPDMDYCNDKYLKSALKIPDTISDLRVYPYSYFYMKNIAFVSRERFKFTGYYKYLKNIIYCTLGVDGYLYFKSSNPLFLYLKKVKVSGIFDDAEEASKYVCDKDGNTCDILDLLFPLQGDMVPSLIEFVVKELTGMAYRQQDKQNDSATSLDDIMNYLKQNVKSDLLKLIEQ